MSFLTPALTAGALLIALPIIFHLVMRRQPTPVVFPALKFVEKRRQTNQTRMRLRHWLLLALRCAAIAMLAFALARPVIKGSGLKGRQGEGSSGELAVAMVVDNSPRLAYQTLDRTRLDDAKELAGWLVGQLPAESQVAVLDRSGGRGKRLAERDTAQARLSRLAIAHNDRPLEDTLVDAVAVLSEREDDRREAYVFTDLTQASWSESTRGAIATLLDENPWLSLQLVDIGGAAASNRGLTPLELSGELLAAGQPLRIDTRIYTQAAAPAPITAQLWLGQGSRAAKRGETIVTPAEPTGEATATFTLPDLDVGVHQGYVELVGSDALPVDDRRYFTIEVEPSRRVLLVAPAGRAEPVFVDQALSPVGPSGDPVGVYRTTIVRPSELTRRPLADFQSVWLLDPPPMDNSQWRAVDDYARGGGSVCIALGRNAATGAFNAPAPQTLLPGPLKWRSRDATYLRPLDYTHPALRQMKPYAESIPWGEFPVFTYWQFDSLAENAYTIAPYANRDAAIIQRPIGRGRAVTVTTPFSDRASGRGDNEPWNLLPTAPAPWPFLALVNNLADYLSGAGDRRWNYPAGETVVIPAPQGEPLAGYVLRMPDGEAVKASQPGLTEIVVAATDQPGSYRLEAGGARGKLDTGFSINTTADAGRLDRLPADELIAALGEDRVRLATTREQLASQIDIGRKGREVYPWLITLVAMMLAAEQWMANRFYREVADSRA